MILIRFDYWGLINIIMMMIINLGIRGENQDFLPWVRQRKPLFLNQFQIFLNAYNAFISDTCMKTKKSATSWMVLVSLMSEVCDHNSFFFFFFFKKKELTREKISGWTQMDSLQQKWGNWGQPTPSPVPQRYWGGRSVKRENVKRNENLKRWYSCVNYHIFFFSKIDQFSF